MFSLVFSIIQWAVCALISWVAVFLTVILAPLVCLPCFVYTAEESETTGYSSLFPGKQREFLIYPFNLLTTFDSPVDELWYTPHYRQGGFSATWTQSEYDSSWWRRYVMRVLWCWRNPAYTVNKMLGYSQRKLTYLYQGSSGDALWDKGYNNLSCYVFQNAQQRIGFSLEFQWFYFRQWCLEVSIGWSHGSESPEGVAKLDSRIIPFKYYPKVPL